MSEGKTSSNGGGGADAGGNGQAPGNSSGEGASSAMEAMLRKRQMSVDSQPDPQPPHATQQQDNTPAGE